MEETFLAAADIGTFERRDIKSLSRLIEECEPVKCSDLSVSKQKQKEIGDWFANCAHQGKPRILVIAGPSGCGKTLAFKVIARENNYDIMEWTSPTDSVAYENRGYSFFFSNCNY